MEMKQTIYKPISTLIEAEKAKCLRCSIPLLYLEIKKLNVGIYFCPKCYVIHNEFYNDEDLKQDKNDDGLGKDRAFIKSPVGGHK